MIKLKKIAKGYYESEDESISIHTNDHMASDDIEYKKWIMTFCGEIYAEAATKKELMKFAESVYL